MRRWYTVALTVALAACSSTPTDDGTQDGVPPSTAAAQGSSTTGSVSADGSAAEPFVGSPHGFWIPRSDPNLTRDIAVDDAGHVWVVGPAGAVRWNPTTGDAERHTPQTGLRITNLFSVAVADDGRVWAAGPAGVANFDGATWNHYLAGTDMPGVAPYQIGVGPNGTVAVTGHDRAAMLRGGAWLETSLPGFASGGSRSSVVDVALDGAAWIATSEGIVRWDGTGAPEVVRHGNAEGVAVGGDGVVYVLIDGLVRFDGTEWTTIDGGGGRGIDVAEDGSVWTASSSVRHYTNGTWETFEGTWYADTVAAGAAGGAWASSTSGHGLWQVTNAQESLLLLEQPSCYPQYMAAASDGTAWGLCDEFNPMWHFDGATWHELEMPREGFLPKLIAVDDTDTLWGVADTGLARWSGDEWIVEAEPDWPFGLVTALAPGPDGSWWVAAYPTDAVEQVEQTDVFPGEDIAFFDGDEWETFRFEWSAWPGLASFEDPANRPDGLPPVVDIAPAGDGSVWISTFAGVFRLAEGVISPQAVYDYHGFDEDSSSMAVAVAPNGNVWATLGRHIGVTTGSEWELHASTDLWPPEGAEPRAIVVAPDGAVWVGTTAGAARYDGVSWTVYDEAAGLGMPFVDQLVGGADGTLWFGTHHGWYLTQLLLDPQGPPLPSAEREPWVAPTTTTEAPDVTPPLLEITTPEDGAVVTEREIVFSGRTEPGAIVAAGPYEAEVDDQGNWSIVLLLDPGGNTARLRATDTAGNTAEVTVSVFYDVLETYLGTTHLGDLPFGTDMGEALEWLGAKFGPHSDELDEQGFFVIRWVRWEETGLSAAFTDADVGYRDDGKWHLAGWIVFAGSADAGLIHEGGASVGVTVGELSAAYGSDLVVPEGPNECSGEWLVYLLVGDESIRLAVDSAPSDSNARVVGMRTGVSHGC